jgi:hypothetical protein
MINTTAMAGPRTSHLSCAVLMPAISPWAGITFAGVKESGLDAVNRSLKELPISCLPNVQNKFNDVENKPVHFKDAFNKSGVNYNMAEDRFRWGNSYLLNAFFR